MGWKKTYNTAPGFVADWSSIDRIGTGYQIDWSRVPQSFKAGVRYTITATAQANAAATSITVAALPISLPVGTVLQFGPDEFAQLTAPAAAGATSLAVAALAAQIENADTATYLVSQSNAKVIPGGTVMCRLSGGKIVPRSARPGSEEAIGLLISTVVEGNLNDALSGYGVINGGVIYENLLPETITSYKTELNSNGTGFAWQTYADSSEA